LPKSAAARRRTGCWWAEFILHFKEVRKLIHVTGCEVAIRREKTLGVSGGHYSRTAGGQTPLDSQFGPTPAKQIIMNINSDNGNRGRNRGGNRGGPRGGRPGRWGRW